MVRHHWWIALPALALLACQGAEERRGAGTAEQSAAVVPPGSTEWKIANAMSAAPASIAKDATLMDWPAEEGGEMTVLRPGTNEWACMPDIPNTPGNDPMCLDEAFLAWAGAWMSRTKPEIEKAGFGYMLQGGSDASNTDPYAPPPERRDAWLESGPHVMIVVPNPAALEGIPTDPHNGGPWVMWQGTPYAHVMVPVPGN